MDPNLFLPPEQLAPGFDLRPAWRLGDEAIERDAIDFWTRTGILPAGVTPQERARELVAVVYKEGSMIGVLTAQVGRLAQVRARLAFVRGAVDPEYRRGHIGLVMYLYARDLLERWSAAHPEERLAGVGAFVESNELSERAKSGNGPTRLGLIGFTPDGRQIRVCWFRDFRLDLS
ncbi:MAG: hypothetical protein QOD42_3614 [Sphingomonadales bacterium]|jgi:hypothetical protein|nr:hypothetical protein [Sphingomonadales bacterium]